MADPSKVAGSLVLEGSIKKGTFMRVVRKRKEVFNGKVGSLRRFKDPVKKVDSGEGCGILRPRWPISWKATSSSVSTYMRENKR